MYKVYKYTSPSNKVYIGITCKNQTARAGKNGIGYRYCPAFWNAISKYGWDNFTYEELATELTEEKAKELEIYYIKKYNSTNPNNGYNISHGGEGYSIYDKEEILKLWNEGLGVKEIIETMNCGKEVVQKTLTNANIPVTERIKRGWDTTEQEETEKKILKLWDSGKAVYEICEELQLKDNSVSYYLTKNKIDGKERIKRSSGRYHIQEVYQYSKNGAFIQKFNSVAEAEKNTGISHCNIVANCKGRRKSAGGFIWSYEKNS